MKHPKFTAHTRLFSHQTVSANSVIVLNRIKTRSMKEYKVELPDLSNIKEGDVLIYNGTRNVATRSRGYYCRRCSMSDVCSDWFNPCCGRAEFYFTEQK